MSAAAADPVDVEAGLKIAVIGDSGIGPDAVAVLELIRDEGADMVIHVGDFDYADNPAGFEAWITGVLGSDFPYFAAVGNHDVAAWSTYRQDLEARLGRVSGAACTGEYGVNASCTFRGLSFLLSGAGTLGSGHTGYLAAELSTNRHTWRICAWHKNQNAMQVGGKANAVGWGPYETCLEHGALIVTGHEHSYSRTKTLVDIDDQVVDPAWPSPTNVRVGPGATIVAVSGLGGRSIRPQRRCLPVTAPYGCNREWAAISSSSNGGTYGALFLELNVGGDPRRGRGTFMDINGRVVDSFEIWSENAIDRFSDDDTSTFEQDIEWIAEHGITKGCNPPVNDRFCPSGRVTRGQMAAFLVRAFGLTDRLDNPFVDDDRSTFQADIEKLAAAGITRGCNPPTNDRFCPDRKVTREQVAAFLVRALGYGDDGGGDLFTDDDESIFQGDIDRLGTAGVTKGCNPPTNDRFCPTDHVTREQMAAFLRRALDT